ncbi:SDR family NAD(P)-dependent oxidoreductase [Capillimicrobium parvum]|uniref:Dihydroanticapsin 7-dehydrogenase n=1 Tax=Capillimicrobium parvum TaxID=2884022 RepID=A0A9E6XV25_9ACTN|nr:SDR family oxidoreductase [Capillimicrobium parvum]UGS34946.1 Dihydroanticapsin 7-dehydrogenase [Capillimicrobium parvum]
MSASLRPRRVLVTGAASGIGASTAARFRAAGDRVAGVDRDAEALQMVELDVRATGDVSDEGSVRAAVDETARALGGLDVLVSAAGVAGRGNVADLDAAEWDRVFAINVRGLFLTAKHAIPHLRNAGGGSIINLASQLGLVAAPDAAAYCASKGAAIQLTRAMAIDHATDGITVNAICPGPTATPMLDAYFDGSDDPDAERADFEATMLTGRFVQPEEIAEAAFYLAHPAARSTTGAVLVVDAGYVIR